MPTFSDAPDPLAGWPAFARAARRRLEAGRTTYGDRSFSRDPAELVVEVQAELEDVAGWAFVLWVRLERLRTALGETLPAPPPEAA